MIEARLFGTFEVSVNGEPLGRLRSRKSYALLAMLLIRADKEVQRDFVCDSLWPDSTREKARVGLRQCLNDVRIALGIHADRISAPSTRSLMFHSDDCEIDVVEFDALLETSEPRPEQVDRLIELWRGPLLEQFPDDFVFYERDIRVRRLSEVLEREATLSLAAGQLGAASRWSTFALRLTPLSESCCRGVMSVLAADRNVPEAIRVYTEFRQRLWRDMRLEPSADTVSVYKSLKAPGVEPGTQKLRTVKPVTKLIGRDPEVAYINALLQDARIVTIVGAAGLGKTRLAMELASTGSYSFIPLAPLTVSELLADHVSREMHVHCPEDRESIEVLLDHLRTGQDVVVLDNAEHLVEACALLVHRLVTETDETKVIVTSRVVLGIPGEHVVHLNPLGTGLAFACSSPFC